tara:strand:- start:2915 stop:3694 length:780 start_codon:yes stop_codon:yes gene_type:complete
MLKNQAQTQGTYGMSLIEVVIALAIAAFILTSAVSFVISITDIWAKREQRYAFYEHADGVSHFLKTSFRHSENIPNSESLTDGETESITQLSSASKSEKQSINSSINKQSSEDEVVPIKWATPKFSDLSGSPLLRFQLRGATPILANESGILPSDNTLYLYFNKDEGLSLLHHSIFQDQFTSEDDYKRTLLSPFVKSIEYIYWDFENETWEIEESTIEELSDSDNNQIPNYLKLNFLYDDQNIERIIPIPQHSEYLILY